MQLWLRADDIGCSSGEAVSSWSDASSNGYSASQSYSAYQPECTGALSSLPTPQPPRSRRLTSNLCTTAARPQAADAWQRRCRTLDHIVVEMEHILGIARMYGRHFVAQFIRIPKAAWLVNDEDIS